MAKKSINDLLNNSNIAKKIKEAYSFMLLSKGYSANEIKILDDYVFIVRKKGVGKSIESDDTEYFDDSTLRNRRKRNNPKNLVCLTSKNEVYNKKDHTLYSFNGSGLTTKGRLVWLIIKQYQKEYAPTYEEISHLFNYKLKLLRNTIINKLSLESLRADRQMRFYYHDTDILESKDGIQYAVSNQWSKDKMAEIISFARSCGWKIEVINPKTNVSSSM